MASLTSTVFSHWPWQQWASEQPNATAIIREQQSVSWRCLADEVNALCNLFYHHGVRAGQGVALNGKNSPELLLGYLAILQLGARVLPLNPQLPDALQAQLLPILNIDWGWSSHSSTWPDRVKSLPSFSIEQLSVSNFDTQLMADWSSAQSLTMTLTSGSSGLPKAAVHTPQAHLANAAGLLQRMPFESGDSWLLSLPLFHVSGQGVIWRWLQKGATLVQRNMHPLDRALAGCTHASLVPTQLWRLLEQDADKLVLKQVLLGGASIPVELTERAQQAGISCWCGYGMTEMASTTCAKPADATAGVGVPLPGRELQLVDNEIWLRGSGQALGYWQQGEIRPLSDSQGWFHTRDRGEMRNGELYICGRMDNLFFSGGEGIQPEDIERVLISHPLIEQAFVVPVDDVEFGQRPVAVVDALPGLDLSQLSAWLEGKITRFQIPDSYYVLPAELKQGGIKISRLAVKEWVKSLNNEVVK
ncbi:o-succinylbenzoate--CoA ligase [Limnobaculum zhutongyuii]|uniref:O-succinylbenzoate--CoA ligase n=1 Tax=Limnobaculum zhutongyuii TaxID=2498113 RepID=A0A411WIC2_9GAMM|nr:o-succinylbenzoate--CoA ligase [Limnobaculum zhutongyuii]QBH95931.1 o-succinylbenzoate--CoA ligase [Limnobaculum zhutongyuii]TQS89360.1 o-succinylbenzoate--CoA ligase [Limnobaculum zhutongyuii]